MINRNRRKILIIDADRKTRSLAKDILAKSDFDVITTETFDEGLDIARRVIFSLIFCDKRQFFLAGTHIFQIGVPVIVTSQDDNDIESAVKAIRQGAVNFAVKLLDVPKLIAMINEALADNEEKVKQLPMVDTFVKVHNGMAQPISDLLIGTSQSMIRLNVLIDKIAPSDARVLILGPNGTGKELVARSVHEKSARRDAPFIEVNCAAIPSELIESELFGHEKGSFTSAVKQHKGKFEQADGGTIFLDEIGDMSLSAQAKVLRALQERRVSRVGGDKDIAVNVRVIAATNKHLIDEVERGNFREDLYHRLSVILIEVPPLRERSDDIPMLTQYFIKTLCREYSVDEKTISREAVEYLKTLKWRGNVRELRNVVERLIILGSNCISLDDVKAHTTANV